MNYSGMNESNVMDESSSSSSSINRYIDSGFYFFFFVSCSIEFQILMLYLAVIYVIANKKKFLDCNNVPGSNTHTHLWG